MQKRLDVIMAVWEEESKQRRSAAEARLEELAENMEENLQRIRERIQIRPGEYLENAEKEAQEIRDRLMHVRYRLSELKTVRDRWKRSMILGNPTMRGSKKLHDHLEELREAVREKINKANGGKEE